MDELVEKIKILKENKIEYFKQGDLEIRFSAEAFVSDLTPDSERENDEEESDEDMLFYSSGVKGLKRNGQQRRA